MNASEALRRLRRLGVPVIATADAATALGQSSFAASKTLARLADAELLTRVRHGLWTADEHVDAYRLAEPLLAPMPAYVSLHSALHLHGMVEQIPSITYVVSLARSRRIATPHGTFSVHHIAPELFGGFVEAAGGFKLATAEKTLFDVAYLSGGRSRLFRSLPELELPRGFRRRELHYWLARIAGERSRTMTARRLEELLART